MYYLLTLLYLNMTILFQSKCCSYHHAFYHKVPVTVVGVVELVPEPPLVGSGVG